MSKLDKDQLDKISGGITEEKTENFRVDGDQGSRAEGVYWEQEVNQAELDDAGGDGPSIQPNTNR